MVRVNLKGIAKVTAKGRTYWYAWRGGPRLRGEPGSPEFVASYNEALEELRAPDQSRFRALVTLYRASADYKSLDRPRRTGQSGSTASPSISASCASRNSIARRRSGR
jgi:hypothetical protein